jgi:outer membrane protein
MINRSLAIAVLGFALLVFGMVRADAAGPSGAKIAYVDLQRTLNQTPVGKKAKAKLERDKKKKQSALDKEQKALQEFAAQLQKQRSVLKPAVLRTREQELQQRYVKLQDTYLKLQQELAAMEATLVRDIFKKASPIIKTIAKQRGFTMVLEKNESAVLWADTSLDITDDVNKMVK